MLVILPRDEAEVNTSEVPQSCVDDNALVLLQALEVQASLSPDYPSFLKPIRRSHISGKFDLILPRKFSDEHMPSHDDTIILVDENEQECTAKFSVHKARLCGGWREFSISHNLQEGEVLIFQLIEPCKFKVYTVRLRNFTENDEAIGCQTPDFLNNKPVDIVNEEGVKEANLTNGKKSRRKLNSPAEDSRSEKKRARTISESKLAADPSCNDNNYVGSDVLEHGQYPESVVNFKDVKGLEDFRIQVDGVILDSELPADLRTKYYELCSSQNMFLHENLIEGLNGKFATAIISEAINIADAIRAATSTTSLNHLEGWDKTLKAFEDLGMAVGFLRDKIHKLLAISRESQAVVDSKKSERAKAKRELRCLREKVSNVKTLIKSLDEGIGDLTMRNEELDSAFKEIASAPW